MHPALTQHPDHKLWKRDFKGASGLFAIEFNDNISDEAVNKQLIVLKFLELALPGEDTRVQYQ